jgi:hypothetical protein
MSTDLQSAKSNTLAWLQIHVRGERGRASWWQAGEHDVRGPRTPATVACSAAGAPEKWVARSCGGPRAGRRGRLRKAMGKDGVLARTVAGSEYFLTESSGIT